MRVGRKWGVCRALFAFGILTSAAVPLAMSPAAQDQTFALEGTTPVSVRDIADTVDGLLGPIVVQHTAARTADYTGSRISNAKAKRLLDWSPTTGFTDGVRRYIDWYRDQGH